ncbi:MAG: alpha/beta hydrolase-fold protein [bacterium]
MLKKILLYLVTSTALVSAQSFPTFLSKLTAVNESERPALVESYLTVSRTYPIIENDTLVYFIYRGPATSVTIPGDPNHWNGNAFPMIQVPGTDLWYYSKSFESDARLDYKFAVSGKEWILDPRNPNKMSGGFGANSELRMPRYLPAPEILFYPDIPHGEVRDTTFTSVILGNSRTVKIYLPPHYESVADSFPVALFHDGLEYVSLAQTQNVLDYLIARKKIQPLIAVFVPPVNRNPEYAGNQITEFCKFISSELFPVLEQKYRLKRNPKYRATLGASNGGNISLWLGYYYASQFGNIAAYSSYVAPPLFSGFQTSARLNLKLYLDIGTYDIPALLPMVRTFYPIVKEKGYEVKYLEFHEGHSWGNWRAHIDDALEFFFPPIQ